MKSTSNFDKDLGSKIANLRVLKGYTRRELAEKLKITQQQLQKYEKGTNRISVSRLSQIADILDISMARIINDKNTFAATKGDRLITDIMKLISGIKDRSKLLSLKNLIMAFVRKV
ncbi:MAG TPA: hypothetical protein DIV86_07750 [Alphaproteobacteria bacterium]|mgnify:FL=1|nr:hypothetical protein [Alphaproteobacteria bacterium]